MSNECRQMCKPNSLETEKFDPIPCQKEFGKLLSCATKEGKHFPEILPLPSLPDLVSLGNVSHIHCCRLRFVPPFCWDYCSGTNTQFEKANRLCVYWMPEIFQCYEQAYRKSLNVENGPRLYLSFFSVPLPGHPEQLVVNPVNSTSLYACWQPPRQRPETIKFYSVRYQEVPRFPFFGGS